MLIPKIFFSRISDQLFFLTFGSLIVNMLRNNCQKRKLLFFSASWHFFGPNEPRLYFSMKKSKKRKHSQFIFLEQLMKYFVTSIFFQIFFSTVYEYELLAIVFRILLKFWYFVRLDRRLFRTHYKIIFHNFFMKT